METQISPMVTITQQHWSALQTFIRLHTKYVTLLFILVVGLFGYRLAPTDLTAGNYAADFQVMLNGEQASLTFPFILGQTSQNTLRVTKRVGAYVLVIEGNDAFPLELGSSLTYRLKVLDTDGLPVALSFDQITSSINGPNYEQILTPTDQIDGWLIFQMRMPHKAKIATAILFVVAGLWLTEIIPLAASALLIPVLAVVAGITDATAVLQPFAHPIIMLFLAGFLMAEGMHRSGVDRLIALAILRRTSLKPPFLMLTLMILTAFLSMWMSNTASIAIIIPITLAVLNRLQDETGQTGFRRALILGVAYAATIGGVGSAIGTPANMLAMTFLNEYTGTSLAFIDWFAYGLPLVLLLIPLAWLYLILTFRVQFGALKISLEPSALETEAEKSDSLDQPQRTILVVFVMIVGLWLTEQWHHIPSAIVALGGVLVLFLLEIVKKEDLNQINWNALLTFGGGLSIGTLLVSTGVSDWVALRLTGLGYLPPLLVVFIVASLTLFTGAFISNTACAAMLIPLAIPLAQILQIDPRLLVAVIAIASSIDFAMVVGTPPTMMAYSTGFFKASEIFKRGIVLDIIGILLLTLGVVWIWQWIGVVTF